MPWPKNVARLPTCRIRKPVKKSKRRLKQEEKERKAKDRRDFERNQPRWKK